MSWQHRIACLTALLTVVGITSVVTSEEPSTPGCLASHCEGPTPALDTERNVLDAPLARCSHKPLTGFYRDGYCRTGPQDRGVHVVCAQVTDDFLTYTARRGNDLSTPNPRFRFPGLKAGDRWCLCASRWEEARRAGVAPRVVLDATQVSAARIVSMEQLRTHAVDPTPP